jgi:hypothetical protein
LGRLNLRSPAGIPGGGPGDLRLSGDRAGRSQATVQAEDTVPTLPTTWGRIKAKYGN